MIDPSTLEQGWYLARLFDNGKKGALSLVWVDGRKPFLRVVPAITDLDSTDWYRSEIRHDLINKTIEWQFVQRIDLPIMEVTT